jgi:hypothetical protein
MSKKSRSYESRELILPDGRKLIVREVQADYYPMIRPKRSVEREMREYDEPRSMRGYEDRPRRRRKSKFGIHGHPAAMFVACLMGGFLAIHISAWLGLAIWAYGAYTLFINALKGK